MVSLRRVGNTLHRAGLSAGHEDALRGPEGQAGTREDHAVYGRESQRGGIHCCMRVQHSRGHGRRG